MRIICIINVILMLFCSLFKQFLLLNKIYYCVNKMFIFEYFYVKQYTNK